MSSPVTVLRPACLASFTALVARMVPFCSSMAVRASAASLLTRPAPTDLISRSTAATERVLIRTDPICALPLKNNLFSGAILLSNRCFLAENHPKSTPPALFIPLFQIIIWRMLQMSSPLASKAVQNLASHHVSISRLLWTACSRKAIVSWCCRLASGKHS